MLWEKRLSQWANEIRAENNLPARLELWNGARYDFGRFAAPQVVFKVRSASAIPLLLDPSLDNLGEAYVKGKIDIDGPLSAIIDVGYALARGTSSSAGRLARVARHFTHSKHSDKKAIQYHYDVSNAFYAEWLDPAMVYSCAYFEQGNETLAAAQQQKIDHILTKLRLQPGQTLLDIGCGWGALVLRAAEAFGARCVGITLSQNQFELATERVRAAGLGDRIDIRLQDYRDVRGPFDRISSVGMFEHVGLKNLASYFRIVRNLLAPDGWALNHGITSSDAHNGETRYGGGQFIGRYVFPQGELPHIGTVMTALQEGGLEPFDAESLRRHYARTLQCWSEAFEAKTERLKALVPEKTWRIWRMYLVGCQWAFEHDELSLFQVLCRRAGQPAATLPWSRRWVYGGAR